MSNWTHLIRFVAKEDNQVHLGQLFDTTRDIGLDSVAGVPITAYEIQGTIYNGTVNKSKVFTVETLLSPVTKDECDYIRCGGLNYHDHAAEANMSLPSSPILFSKPKNALIGPYPDPVTIPKVAQDGTSDFEAELCIVIGKKGKDIKEEDAIDYVAGYTCSNDISARTLQFETSQWTLSKGLDRSCPIGPVLVSKEALGDPHSLGIRCIYNGNIEQDGNTKNMIFSVQKHIAAFSRGTTLTPGTIILTGTPAGIGYFKNPRVTLEKGSDVRVYIEKIGTLVNKVEFE